MVEWSNIIHHPLYIKHLTGAGSYQGLSYNKGSIT